jgi:ribose-phosphate pyrophosphokinase
MNAHRGSAVLSSANLKVQRAATAPTENHRLRLFSGSANVPLSQEVARYLGMENFMFKSKNRFGVVMFI